MGHLTEVRSVVGQRILYLRPDLAEVALARDFLREVAVGAGLVEDRVFDLCVAASEACANAIEHAHGSGRVQVEVLLHPDRVEVQILGPGEFHVPAPGSERDHRGLGLPLMATLSDHLALYSGPQGGTLVSLTFYLPGAPRGNQLHAVLDERGPLSKERQRTMELADALAEVDRALHSSLDFDEIARRAVSEGAKALGAETAALATREEGGFRVAYIYGWPEEIVGEFVPDEKDIHSVLALQTGEILAIDDTSSDGRVRRELMEEYGVRSVLVVPLLVRGEALACLYFNYNSHPHSFSQPEIDFVSKLGSSLSLALQNARLMASAREELSRSRLLQEVAVAASGEGTLERTAGEILAALARNLGASAADISLLQPPGERVLLLAHFGLAEGRYAELRDVPLEEAGFLTTTAIRERRLLTQEADVVDDTRLATLRRLGLESSRYLVSPLLHHGQILGVLHLAFAGKRPFTGAELELVHAVSHSVAQAVAHARLLEAEREARSAIESMLDLAPAFHAEDSLERLAVTVCRAAQDTFRTTAASLYDVERDCLRLLARAPEDEAVKLGDVLLISESPGLARALRQSSPTFFTDASRQELCDAVGAAGNGIKSAVGVPLRAAGEASYLLVLSWDTHRGPLWPGELALLQRFADQATVALEHAEVTGLHNRLEARLLPAVSVEHPGLSIVTRYRPGDRRLGVGGDFYGLLSYADGRLGFVVGDVSGHGPDAAALGATLRASWRALSMSGAGLDTVVSFLNRLVLDEGRRTEMYCTLLAGWVDPRRKKLRMVNAGHPQPLVLGPGPVAALPVRPVPPLGFFDDLDDWKVQTFDLREGWALLLFTDGLFEGRAAPGSRERYGIERLMAYLRQARPRWQRQSVDELLNEVEAANGGPLPDDIALVFLTAGAPSQD